jgi:putative flippase GtrA
VNNEIFKYVISGGLAFILDFSVLYICTEFLSIHYLISNLLGYFAGLTVAYTLNIYWVFSYRRIKQTWLELAIFNMIVIAGLGVSEAIMAVLVENMDIYYLYAKIVAGFFVMIFNYTAKKFILFHPTSKKGYLE